MEYKLVIDQATIDEYNELYFKTHPRAKKVAIERPLLMSMNQFLLMKRPQQNFVKNKYKEFGVWLCKKLGYDGLGLDKFEVEVTSYHPSRRLFDLDNLSCGFKLLADSFTECGFIVDDNYTKLTKLTLCGDYSKDNPRTEITVKTIDD